MGQKLTKGKTERAKIANRLAQDKNELERVKDEVDNELIAAKRSKDFVKT